MASAQLAALLRHIRNLTTEQRRSEQTDGELLRTFLNGNDQAAFAALMRRHGPMVLRVCLRALGNAHDAEDALQATFLVLARQAASIRKKEALASWLHGVAYRMASHAKRAAARRHKYETQASPTQPRDPALCAAWQELQALLDAEIEGLPETLRAPFILCCLENRSSAEAARQLGLKEGTVSVRLSRARKLLQERLARRGVSLTAVLAAAAVGAGGARAVVPGSVVAPTAKAAAQVAAGQALTGGPVSGKVLALVEGVTRAMSLSKGKAALLLLVSTAVVAAGLGLAALHRAAAQAPPRALQESQLPADEPPKKGKQPPADAPGPAGAREAVRVGGQPDLPPEVRQALERNARAFAPIALTVVTRRSLPEPRSQLAQELLKGGDGFLKPWTEEYLSQDGLCSTRGGSGDPPRSWSTELSCDGKCVYQGQPSDSPPSVSIMPLDKAKDRWWWVRWYLGGDHYFHMIGIEPPATVKALAEGPRSEVLHLVEEKGRVTGARVEPVAGGAEHFVVDLLSGGKKHRFWLDPSLGHAVRRHEVSAASGELGVVIENSDFIQLTDAELWLPRHCRCEWHTSPVPTMGWKEFTREPALVADVQATRLERLRVDPGRFTLDHTKPGTHVIDYGLPGADKEPDGIHYVVPEAPANVEAVPRAGQPGKGDVPPRRHVSLWIVAGMSALGALAGALALLLRRRQRSKTS